MGTMHINNWVYVATALRDQGYTTDLIVWNPPERELGEIEYDIVMSQRFPFFFSFPMGRYLLQISFFMWSVSRYDLVICCFTGRIMDRSYLLRWLELPLLKLSGLKIILNTFGADVMTPRKTLGNLYKYSILSAYVTDEDYIGIDEEEICINRKYCQFWCDCVISAIDHVQYLDRIDEYFHMRCVDTDQYVAAEPPDNKIPVILHACNHRHIKGTDFLIETIETLKKEGVACRLNLLENRPHGEVIRAVHGADIIADQFLIGAYARFSIEAMALEKPVVCYLREDLFPFNPIWKECPIVNADPDSLKEKLRELILMSSKDRLEIGKNSRKYVEKYHSQAYVGRRLNEIIMRIWKQGEPEGACPVS